MASGKRTYPGVIQWAIGAALDFLGLVLIGLRGAIPDLLSVVAGNLLVGSTIVFITRGIQAFLGERPRNLLDVGSMVLLAAMMLASLYAWPSVNTRIILWSAMFAFQAGRCFLVVWLDMPRVMPGRDWLLLGSIGLTGAWYLVRAVLALALHPQLVDFLASDLFQAVTVAMTMGTTVILFISLIVTKVKRLERDLGAVRHEVENLSELLPICSSCKRIRGEDGTWTQVETYIGKHSDLAFTHSLCPACTATLYPEAAAAMEKKRGK